MIYTLRLPITCLRRGDLEKHHVSTKKAIRLISRLSIFVSLNSKNFTVLPNLNSKNLNERT